MPYDKSMPAHRRVDKLFEDNYPLWRPKYDAMHELARFLAGDRYVDDGGAFNRDRRGVQIRGQDIQDTIRHSVAKATEKPRSVEGRPKDNQGDADVAELMVSLVTDELSDPWKGFSSERYAAIQTCKEMRLGVVWMDLVPDFGPYGSEMFYSWQAPDRIMWEAPYHPHHPLCGWLIRDRRIDVDQAREMYGAKWIEPDKASFSSRGNWRAGTPLISGYTDWVAASCIYDNKATIRECWYKNDRSVAKDQKYAGEEPVDPENRYLVCAPGADPESGCGFRSDTQDALQATGAIQGELPEALPGACPTCGADLHRIDAQDVNQSVLAFSRGRRLVVTAPFSPNPKDVPAADSSWPVPKARSFPAYFCFASVKPGDVMGPCDVDWMWDQQVAQDNLDTMAIHRVFESRTYWEMPEVGMNDHRKKRFEFRNDQRNVIFRDATKARHGPMEIKPHQAAALDPSWGVVRQVINADLTRYRPSGDISLTEENSKDIAAKTVELVQKQGEVSNEDFKRRDNLELAKFYGVVSDYISATYTPNRMSRLNIEGGDILMRLEGGDLPNLDFVLEDTPEFTGIAKERAAAFDQAIQVSMQLGPEGLDAWGQFHNVPRSVIRNIQKMLASRMAQTEEMGMAGGQGMSGNGLPPPPGMEATGQVGMNGGPNPADMSSAEVA